MTRVVEWWAGVRAVRIGRWGLFRERRYRHAARVFATAGACLGFGLGSLYAQSQGELLTTSASPFLTLLERSIWPILSAVAGGLLAYGKASVRIDQLERALDAKANHETVTVQFAAVTDRMDILRSDFREDMASLRANVTAMVGEIPQQVALAMQQGKRR